MNLKNKDHSSNLVHELCNKNDIGRFDYCHFPEKKHDVSKEEVVNKRKTNTYYTNSNSNKEEILNSSI